MDRFDKQKVWFKKIMHEVCSTLCNSFKIDLKEEMKKKVDKLLAKNNFKKHMFQKQIIELKEANVKLQYEIDESEQYGRRPYTRIEGIPEVCNKSSDVFNNVVHMYVKAGIGNVEQNIDRGHCIIPKEYNCQIYLIQILY